MLHQLLEGAGLGARLDQPLERVGAFALGMLLLDLFVCCGPLRQLFLRAFSQGPAGTEQARRFLSQLAAKLVGMVFLASVLPLAFRALREPGLRAGDGFRGTTPPSQHMVELSSGYFVYDLVICLLKFSDNGFEFLLHAVVCCSVYSTAAFKGVLHYYGAAFLMWELSTPFMYLRWLMLKAGFGGSPPMLAVNLAFMLSFFGCRIVWGPVTTVAFWNDSVVQLGMADPALPPSAIWIIRAMSVALNLLNTYWFSQMVRMAVKGGEPKTKAV